MNPTAVADALQEAQDEARSARMSFAGGAAATGVVGACCAGLATLAAGALGLTGLAAALSRPTADLVLFPLLFVGLAFTYHAWRRRQACQSCVDDLQTSFPPTTGAPKP